jgi:hypothetical protein
MTENADMLKVESRNLEILKSGPPSFNFGAARS